MEQAAVSLAERRAVLRALAGALRDVRTVLFQAAGGDLADIAGELAELRALAGAGLAATVVETRGVIAESQCASTRTWVAEVAWHSKREASAVAKTARVLARAELAPVADGGPTDIDNAALLCGRHHTIVHRDHLAGTVNHDAATHHNTTGSPVTGVERRLDWRRGRWISSLMLPMVRQWRVCS